MRHFETMGIGCIKQVALWSRWHSGTVAHRDKRAVAPVATSSLFLPLRRVDLSLFVRSLLSSPVNFGFDRRGGASNSPEFVSENILLRSRMRMMISCWVCWCGFVTVVSGFCPRPCLRWSTSTTVVGKCQNHEGSLQLWQIHLTTLRNPCNNFWSRPCLRWSASTTLVGKC